MPCNDEKNFMTLEQNICPVCGNTFNTGCIFLHRYLKKAFNKYTVTAMSLCPEHQKQLDDGYIFLVEVKSDSVPDGTKMLRQQDADRTGNIVSIKRHVAEHIFGEKEIQDINFVDEQVIPVLQQLMSGDKDELAEDEAAEVGNTR